MTNRYTAIIQKPDKWWIGWIEEVPGVNAQARTREALLQELQIVLREALDYNRQEARAAAETDYVEELISA